MTEPLFFPKLKGLTDEKDKGHVKNHCGNKAFIGEVVTPVQPSPDPKNVLECDRAQDYGAVQHENNFIRVRGQGATKCAWQYDATHHLYF